MDDSQEKPEPVKTDSGFSVFYKNKFLYSKRNPQKSILNLLENLDIPDHTLVLCMSPVLDYGLRELEVRLPENSLAAAAEADKNLAALAAKMIDGNLFKNGKLFYFHCSSPFQFIQAAEPLIKKTGITRVVRIDFSAGAALYPDFYMQIEALTHDYISRFWRNRLTLIRFGRNYARNFFKNYAAMKKNKNRISFLKTGYVDKPVIVLGAGPSLDTVLPFIVKNRELLFVLTTDAACKGLYSVLEPDAAVLLESQYWIQKAFIGLKNTNLTVFADMTSNPNAALSTDGQVEFFFTEYTEHPFFYALYKKNLLPERFEPMGSVGLTALRLAEKIAAKNVPIFHAGLDFSWKRGFTHSRLSFQVYETFFECSRLSPLYKPESLFQEKTHSEPGKKEGACFTTPVLNGYAETYRFVFSGKKNIFDLSEDGLPLHSNIISFDEAETLLSVYHSKANGKGGKTSCGRTNKALKNRLQTKSLFEQSTQKTDLQTANSSKDVSRYFDLENITRFLSAEKEKMHELKNIFTGKKNADESFIKALLESVPYLYLHFPDYAKKNLMNKDFLNRIRAELDYFLKILD